MNNPLFSSTAGLLPIVLLSVALAGCPLGNDDPDPGSVTAMAVAGTDGQATDPAQVVPTQNLGNFSVAFTLANLSRSSPRATLLLRAPGSGEEIELFSECCNASAGNCANQTVACRYTGANTLACGGSLPVSLAGFFQRNGGVPNTAQLVLRSNTLQCTNTLLHEDTQRVFTASRGVVLR